MGFIDFTNGEVLTADQMDTTFRQTVMRFADATARDTALSGVLAEGMLAYLDDTNEVLKYDGSSWVSIIETADDVITTEGDLIIGDASGDASRLAIGSSNTVLTSNGTTASWQAAAGGGNDWTKLVSDTSITTGVSSYTITGLSGYNNYSISFKNVRTSAGAGAYLEYDVNSYFYTFGYTTLNIMSSLTTSSNGNSNKLAHSDRDTAGMAASLFLFDTQSDYMQVQALGGGASGDNGIVGNYLAPKNSALSSITISLTAGTFTAGFIDIYGA